MPKKNKSIADLFNIKTRFLRSVHLERDFDSPDDCAGYIATDHTKGCLKRLSEGMMPGSTRRCLALDWRLWSRQIQLCLAVCLFIFRPS